MDEDATAKLLEYAKLSVGREHGLDEAASRRLVGTSVDELHRNAKAMAKEVGAYDPTERARDEGGSFAGADKNRIIRAASGRG